MVTFDWDDANEEHISRHAVTPEEAEEAFFDVSRTRADVYSTGNERRRGLLGRTEEGRLLFVIYTLRAGAIRVITARDASPQHRRLYARHSRS